MIVFLALLVIRLFGRLLRAAWTDPVDPVSNTVITVAYAIANFLTQLRWLRTLTGGADPPGSNYFVRSTSVSGTTWDTGAAGIAAVQGFQSVNRTGDTMSGDLTVLGLVASLHGVAAGPGGVNGGSSAGYGGGTTSSGIPSVLGLGVGTSGILSTGALSGAAVTGTTGSFTGAVSSLAGISGTTGSFSAVIASSLATGTAPLSITSTTKVTNLNVDKLDGADATATPTANAIPIADGSGLLDAWVSASAGVMPSGMGAIWSNTVASIPAGWSRWTALNGRLPVGAGTTFSTSFTEGASYGTSWSHDHTTPAHSHSGSGLSVSGTTGNNSATGQSAGTGTNRADDPHTHSFSAAVAGNTATDGSGTSGSTAWVIPMFGVVYVTKN